MNSILNELDWIFKSSMQGEKIPRYPLTNIGYDDEDNLFIEIAVAGFNKNDIKINLRGNEIHIIGEKKDTNESNIRKYLQQHISTNNFERIIVLHELYVNGDIDAEFQNGILTIIVKPKESAKKEIKIK